MVVKLVLGYGSNTGVQYSEIASLSGQETEKLNDWMNQSSKVVRFDEGRGSVLAEIGFGEVFRSVWWGRGFAIALIPFSFNISL